MTPAKIGKSDRVVSCAAGMLLCLEADSAADYTNFSKLAELERDRIVWTLVDRNEWGSPDPKPAYEDILLDQGYSFANATGWTSRAIDLAEKQGWNEFRPLVQKIYDTPGNQWNYERAFRYLRAGDGRPVSEKLIKAAEILRTAGSFGNNVSDEMIAEPAVASMLEEKDHEAVLVYTLQVACWHAGKGGSRRGREAAANVLKSLPEEIVTRRILQLHQDSPGYVKPEIEWLMRYLKIPLPDS